MDKGFPSLPILGGMILTLLVSAALSVWLSGRLRWSPPGWLRVLDHPNQRSLHHQPTPRTGGLALLGGLMAGLVMSFLVAGWPTGMSAQLMGALLGAALLVAVVSFLDDWRDLPRRYRFLAHVVAAVVLVLAGMRWNVIGLPGLAEPWPSLLVWPLSLLFIVWMINLYNFMDGMDGFAASMAVFGFGALAWLGLEQGAWWFALLNALVVSGALGFLTANFPPARLFLGDVGSSVLGLMAAGSSLWGAALGLFPLWVAWLAFSPFIVDATWTLLRRALNGERIWEAHRSHHYQRLVLAGWSHRKTLVRAVFVMAAAALCAVAASHQSVADQWFVFGGWAAIYLVIHWRVQLAAAASEHR